MGAESRNLAREAPGPRNLDFHKKMNREIMILKGRGILIVFVITAGGGPLAPKRIQRDTIAIITIYYNCNYDSKYNIG